MKKCIDHLEFFVNNIQKTQLHFNHVDLNFGQQLAIGMLQRLLHVSITFKFTLENIEKFPQLEFSAGLSGRAVILDTLIITDLITSLVEPEEKLTQEQLKIKSEELIKAILSDGLNSTLDYFAIAYQYRYVNETKAKILFNSFALRYKDFLKPKEMDGVKPEVLFKKQINAKDIFIKLAKEPITKDLGKIYDTYLFYSKYDHFSAMYFDAINTPLEKKIQHLNTCIEILISHQMNLFFILSYWSNNDDFVKEQFNKAAAYSEKNHNKS